ncbi:MAG: Na-translocating system protein MpsC family protein, partial [Chitinivibrionales bacterium]
MNIRRKKSMSPGEIEASVAEMILSFIKDVTGKGPSDIKVSILEDMILARMKGVLTRGEKFLIAEDHFADTVERVKRNKTGVFESGRTIIENGVR